MKVLRIFFVFNFIIDRNSSYPSIIATLWLFTQIFFFEGLEISFNLLIKSLYLINTKKHLKKFIMKKLWIGAVLGLAFLGSCAQNKEKREEFKDERDKEYLRNSMGDTAAAHSESATADSLKMKADTTKVK